MSQQKFIKKIKKGFLRETASPGLRQFLATEILLKIMKNAFYYTLKTLFLIKIFLS